MQIANDRLGVRPIYEPDDEVSVFCTNTHVHISTPKEGDEPIPAQTGDYCGMEFGPTDRLNITINQTMIFIAATHESPNQTIKRMLEAKIAAGDAKQRIPPGPLIEIRIPRNK